MDTNTKIKGKKQTTINKVLQHLKRFKRITIQEIIVKFHPNCPYSIIRDLRKKYNISDELINNKGVKRYIYNGEI